MDREHYASYFREEANHEIARLEGVLRDSRSTEEDRAVAREMLRFYKDARMVEEGSSVHALEPEYLVSRQTGRALDDTNLNETKDTAYKKMRAAY